jgi:hypothetical protein
MDKLDRLDIVLRRKNGSVVASIPQLSLYAKGANIDAALAALEAKKAALAADLEEMGELDRFEPDPLIMPNGRPIAATTSGDLRQFAIKAAIVAAAFAVVVVVSGLLVASRIQSAVSSFKEAFRGGQEFWVRVEREVDRMASPEADLPAAKKQKLLADIHAIGAKWRPFIVELHSAFAMPDERPTSQPEQGTGK